MKITRFEDLKIWKESIQLSVQIYKLSDRGKLKTDFGLKDQIRRASLSISNNIAEGIEYHSNKQFIRFLNYAKGSAGEVRSQLFFLREVGMINKESYDLNYNQTVSLSKQIKGFIKYLKDNIDR